MLVAALAWWAGRQVALPEESDTDQVPNAPSYLAQAGSLENVLSFTGSLLWEPESSATAPGSGVVTQIDLSAGGSIASGTPVYHINEEAVIACEGVVPAYRDLHLGDHGRDVAQLRACVGLDGGERFDEDLRVALADGGIFHLDNPAVVPRGAVIFLAELPARGYLAEGIQVGSTVTAGQEVIIIAGQTPDVTLAVGGSAPVTLTQGMVVTAEISGAPVEGELGPGATDGATGESTFVVLAPDGGPVCDGTCADQAPLPGPVNVPLRVTVTPRAEGVIVPVSAIRTLPDGTTQVTRVEGGPVEVSVLTSVGGQAVVQGLDAGAEILVFAPDN